MIEINANIRYVDFHMNLDLQLPARGITAIFGPSASGKTSLLRCIAGLDQHNNARVSFAGTVWQSENEFIPSHTRNLSFVYQEPSLFTHLDVMGNLRFALERAATSQSPYSLTQIIEIFNLPTLLSRRVHELSGGERQRVAIAQALARRPGLLLMDEPLASLDGAAKKQLMAILEELHHSMKIPVLYVSHAVEEIYRLADQILLLEKGEVKALCSLDQALTRLDLPLSHGPQATAVVEASVQRHMDDYQLTQLQSSVGHLFMPRCDYPPGKVLRLGLAARDVSISLSHHQDTSILNIIPARVDTMEAIGGSQVLLRLLANNTPLLARISKKSAEELALQAGKAVFAQIKGVALL